MSNQTLFGALRGAGELLEVGMNDAQVFLPNSGKRAIGTTDLNGCSCVLILGRTAILLAHISPLPDQHQRDNSRTMHEQSHDHHAKFLADVTNMLSQHADHFPPSSTAWGIFSCGRDSVGPVESIVHQVQTHLDAIGYTMRPAFYQVLDAHAVVPPKGELVSFFNKDNIAELWLERKKLWPPQQQQATPQVSASQATAQNQWFGYPLSDSQGGRVLSCAISGQNYGLNATWSPGQTFPMVYLWQNWLQTEKAPDADVLFVRHGTALIRLEKP